jgi:hypothetical protein
MSILDSGVKDSIRRTDKFLKRMELLEKVVVYGTILAWLFVTVQAFV